MNWFAIVFFVGLGIVLIVWRGPIAHWQGLMAGGRLHPGCALAEGVLFLLAAIAVFVWRPY